MAEFLHEVVRKHERNGALWRQEFPTQYVSIYRNVYIEARYSGVISEGNYQFMANIRHWVDDPSHAFARRVMTDISCEHRWYIDLGSSTPTLYRYRCMDCHASILQNTRGARHE